jgi:hypothetical protein
MASRVGYGLVATAITLAIVVAVIGIGKHVKSDITEVGVFDKSKIIKAEPLKPADLNLTVHASETMDILNENVATSNGVRGIIVKRKEGPVWTKPPQVALVVCSNPKINHAAKTAEVVWFQTTDGHTGWLVVCKLGPN